MILGASFILFPYNIKPIREACDETQSVLGYDASHVLGLIAGGAFQDPLGDGVDIVTGSTHKTLFGPQGGLILTNREEIFAQVTGKLAWHTLDNAHQNRIAALGQALLEHKEFGGDYALQVIKNSKHFAQALSEAGIPIRFSALNYTKSHQVLMDIDEIKLKFGLNSTELMNLLEGQNIIVDAVGRLGTSEMTRRGCKEEDMERIAEFMARVIINHDTGVARDIKGFLKNCRLSYCY